MIPPCNLIDRQELAKEIIDTVVIDNLQQRKGETSEDSLLLFCQILHHEKTRFNIDDKQVHSFLIRGITANQINYICSEDIHVVHALINGSREALFSVVSMVRLEHGISLLGMENEHKKDHNLLRVLTEKAIERIKQLPEVNSKLMSMFSTENNMAVSRMNISSVLDLLIEANEEILLEKMIDELIDLHPSILFTILKLLKPSSRSSDAFNKVLHSLVISKNGIRHYLG